MTYLFRRAQALEIESRRHDPREFRAHEYGCSILSDYEYRYERMTDSKSEPVGKYRLNLTISIPFAPSAKSIFRRHLTPLRLGLGSSEETGPDEADFAASLLALGCDPLVVLTKFPFRALAHIQRFCPRCNLRERH
jgi:hypothetical protein